MKLLLFLGATAVAVGTAIVLMKPSGEVETAGRRPPVFGIDQTVVLPSGYGAKITSMRYIGGAWEYAMGNDVYSEESLQPAMERYTVIPAELPLLSAGAP